MPKPTQEHIDKAPGMVHWFNPMLLVKLLWHVIVSDMFGRFADRRLIHAALDYATPAEHMSRADIRDNINPQDSNQLWFDYVSDLGDGFESTYAIAYLLAQDELTVGNEKLPRGRLLVMGGDQVYPDASQKDYRDRMLNPYEWAFPRGQRGDNLIYAIPGNHDWYDGLNMFLALFCKPRGGRIGGWHTRQRRSYFAIRLTERWWLWAIDIQLSHDMDQPQFDYFEAIATSMPDNSNIILCSAEPGWYHADVKDSPSFKPLHFAAWIAENAKKNHKIFAALSGDTHHYSRYSSDDIGTQFITAGGGGAFLHPTHMLRTKIEGEWLRKKLKFSLNTEPGGDHTESETLACHPKPATSKALLANNLLFPFLNFGLAFIVGLVYWVTAVAVALRGEAIYYGFAILLSAILIGYTAQQEGKTWKILYSLPHALAHVAAVYCLTELFTWFNIYAGASSYWLFHSALLIEMLTIGALVGGLIFGIYLLLTCLLCGMNDNDAFSAMRLNSYRHFLRICVEADTLTIYVLGLDRPPSREQWKVNPDMNSKPLASQIVPKCELQVSLIEKIVIQAKNVQPIAEIAR